jgi:hypothetical protein
LAREVEDPTLNWNNLLKVLLIAVLIVIALALLLAIVGSR